MMLRIGLIISEMRKKRSVRKGKEKDVKRIEKILNEGLKS